jgi:hypothetical protein
MNFLGIIGYIMPFPKVETGVSFQSVQLSESFRSDTIQLPMYIPVPFGDSGEASHAVHSILGMDRTVFPQKFGAVEQTMIAELPLETAIDEY